MGPTTTRAGISPPPDQRDLDAYYASLTPAVPAQVIVDGADPTTAAGATTDTGHPAAAHHPVAASEEAAP